MATATSTSSAPARAGSTCSRISGSNPDPRLPAREVTLATESDASATVVALWRYPLKSLQGEELNSAQVTERGLVGDRAYALIDAAEGKVVSAKNPKKWPAMFDYRADFIEPPE